MEGYGVNILYTICFNIENDAESINEFWQKIHSCIFGGRCAISYLWREQRTQWLTQSVGGCLTLNVTDDSFYQLETAQGILKQL